MEWTTVDFRPAPAPVEGERVKRVKKEIRSERAMLGWKCLYLTGVKNTPYMDIPLAGWLIQRREEQIRVVAGVIVSDGTVHAWDESLGFTNGPHTARLPWCVIEPLHHKDWPSKYEAQRRWQAIQGSSIIEDSQR